MMTCLLSTKPLLTFTIRLGNAPLLLIFEETINRSVVEGELEGFIKGIGWRGVGVCVEKTHSKKWMRRRVKRRRQQQE